MWDSLEWDEDGTVPTKVEAWAVNAWLFNEDTVDKVLAHLMSEGITVKGGDRLGKTIIFAKSQAHAEFIVKRFDANYPQYKGAFARTIHHDVTYAQSLIDDFSKPDAMPHIAVSVDMLDTGIDVPEDLVFFKPVYAKSKFWQMIGRGTRLRPDLFAPGEHKSCFYVFDYCQNFEFFKQCLPAAEGRLTDSLSRRLFMTRLELVGALDAEKVDGEVREETAGTLHAEVAAMNVDNFLVRPKRKWVERYADRSAWKELGPDDLHALATEVAGLPSEIPAEDEEAKRFDLLMLRLQLALLRKEPSYDRLRTNVVDIASRPEEQANIPMVREQLALRRSRSSTGWSARSSSATTSQRAAAPRDPRRAAGDRALEQRQRCDLLRQRLRADRRRPRKPGSLHARHAPAPIRARAAQHSAPPNRARGAPVGRTARRRRPAWAHAAVLVNINPYGTFHLDMTRRLALGLPLTSGESAVLA